MRPAGSVFLSTNVLFHVVFCFVLLEVVSRLTEGAIGFRPGYASSRCPNRGFEMLRAELSTGMFLTKPLYNCGFGGIDSSTR